MFRYVKEKFLTPEELQEQRKQRYPILRDNLIKYINDQLIINEYQITLCERDKELFFNLDLQKELENISKLQYVGAEGDMRTNIWKIRFRKI
jgi:hypothetical protein